MVIEVPLIYIGVLITYSTLLHLMFYVAVHGWPIHTGSGMGLRLLNTHVPLMDTLQDIRSHGRWNDYSVVQENKVFSNMQVISEVPECAK